MQFMTKRALESFLFRVTALCLGLDPEAGEVQSRIRISWPTDPNASSSNPGWTRDENVVFLRIAKGIDPYAHPENTVYAENDAGEYVERVTSTVCHSITWIFYGPDATEDAALVRAALLRDVIRELFHERSMYVVQRINDPMRFDEVYGGQWWHRCDLTAQFYEGVVREFPATCIEQAPTISIKEGE